MSGALSCPIYLYTTMGSSKNIYPLVDLDNSKISDHIFWVGSKNKLDEFLFLFFSTTR
jgi:hypothetical protein